MKRVKAKGIEVVVYEPELNEVNFLIHVLNTTSSHLNRVLIIENRMSPELEDVQKKCFRAICMGHQIWKLMNKKALQQVQLIYWLSFIKSARRGMVCFGLDCMSDYYDVFQRAVSMLLQNPSYRSVHG